MSIFLPKINIEPNFTKSERKVCLGQFFLNSLNYPSRKKWPLQEDGQNRKNNQQSLSKLTVVGSNIIWSANVNKELYKHVQ